MLVFYKMPLDRPNLHYERLMQFAEGVVNQRPKADIQSVCIVLQKYIRVTKIRGDFNAVKNNNIITITSKKSRSQLANIIHLA